MGSPADNLKRAFHDISTLDIHEAHLIADETHHCESCDNIRKIFEDAEYFYALNDRLYGMFDKAYDRDEIVKKFRQKYGKYKV